LDISKGPEVLDLSTLVKHAAFTQLWYNIITNQGDTMPIQELDEMENLLDEVTDCFEDTMKQLFDEDPGLFETRFSNGEVKVHSTKAHWNSQVSGAGDEFKKELNKLVEKFEVRLLQGDFS